VYIELGMPGDQDVVGLGAVIDAIHQHLQPQLVRAVDIALQRRETLPTGARVVAGNA
jgi:hypothetical protein